MKESELFDQTNCHSEDTKVPEETVGRAKAKVSKYILRYLFRWDAAAYRLNQIEDKDIIETIGYDKRKILTQIILQ
ncbi:MAG TPA: hypothetical protein VLM39_03795 [Ignavibacteriaceae bacterium]|nr:hypothetical protein [Ignavibacteriaceae bacterium]